MGAETIKQPDRATKVAPLPREKKKQVLQFQLICVVVSNMFYFHPYLGKIPIFTNMFQMGWNHQPVIDSQ